MRTDSEKAKEQELISLVYQEKANLDAKRQKRDGVVVTPTQVVDFQIRSVIAAIKNEHKLEPDEGIEWLDPFGGSGIYTARLLQIVDLPPERKYALSQNCIVVEIDPIAAQICADNLARVLKEETGIDGYIRVICTDTFALSSDADLWDESLSVIYPKNSDSPFLRHNFDDVYFINFGKGVIKRRHAITEEALQYFADAIVGVTPTRTDIFFYVYGYLHNREYIEKYKHNLSKELPRIPKPKNNEEFNRFKSLGEKLAFLHLNFDNKKISKYPVRIEYSKDFKDEDFYYRVDKMKFGKNDDGTKNITTVIYNKYISIMDIPLEAYNYNCGNKTALEWVMERQSVSTHKDSGIVNDANDWANETMHNPRYILELFQRVITVSLETVKLVSGGRSEYPPIDFDGRPFFNMAIGWGANSLGVFCPLIVDITPDVHAAGGLTSQFFPLFLYN